MHASRRPTPSRRPPAGRTPSPEPRPRRLQRLTGLLEARGDRRLHLWRVQQVVQAVCIQPALADRHAGVGGQVAAGAGGTAGAGVVPGRPRQVAGVVLRGRSERRVARGGIGWRRDAQVGGWEQRPSQPACGFHAASHQATTDKQGGARLQAQQRGRRRVHAQPAGRQRGAPRRVVDVDQGGVVLGCSGPTVAGRRGGRRAGQAAAQAPRGAATAAGPPPCPAPSQQQQAQAIGTAAAHRWGQTSRRCPPAGGSPPTASGRARAAARAAAARRGGGHDRARVSAARAAAASPRRRASAAAACAMQGADHMRAPVPSHPVARPRSRAGARTGGGGGGGSESGGCAR